MARTVLLDLDGTLVDSAAGILGTLRIALGRAGVAHDDSVLGPHLLGPPLYESLPPLIGAAETVQVLEIYRPLYREHGVHASVPYPGIDALLRALVAAGRRIGLATSKPEPAARAILEDRGWTDLFTAITGDTLDAQRPTKAAVVGEALRRLGDPDPADTVMVGDRLHDVVGARTHGLPCLGAGWGYAEPGELAAAGAAAVHATPADLYRALLP